MVTKSDLLSFLQCPRKLWLERKRQDLLPPEDPSSYRRATEGNIVSAWARAQLGANFLWPPSAADLATAADQARILLAEHEDMPAAEVPMQHAGLYARADALVPAEGGYVLRETKASSFPLKRDKTTPDAPKEHHLNDLTIQAWVMRASGLPMTRAELNLLNSQWRYPGEEDYTGLFRQLDVTVEVQSRLADVPQWQQHAENTLAAAMPTVTTGKHCGNPYPCPFNTFCRGLEPPGPKHPLELLPDRAGKTLAKKLREAKGYTSIIEPQPEELTGAQATLYRRIQQAHQTGAPVLASGSEVTMAAFSYPRYFLDFECIDFPVPRWAGVRPYEHIPFQWSCHIERRPGVFIHSEFLDLSGNDPSPRCVDALRATIDPNDDGPIFVYSMSYEKGRFQQLAERYPQHAALLDAYVARLVDLLPLVREFFYHPAMHGSFSIKKVLPVIAPDLNYDDLEEVQEGTGAQLAYLYAACDPTTTAERKSDLEAKLRAYCRRDTWAMVEVAYFLATMGRPVRPAGM